MDDSNDLRNDTPESIVTITETALSFLQQYGWFLLILMVAFVYLKTRFLDPMRCRHRMKIETHDRKKSDATKVLACMEGLERSRQHLQDQFSRQAEEYKIRQKQKAEKARLEKISQWRRQDGYSCDWRDDQDKTAGTTASKKNKKQLETPSDACPLSRSYNSVVYRPPWRGGTRSG